ncbi:recombinase family protein [Actinomadura syzygii]|uniref:Recombinase family protein n=1 Tax=Actinomadura syzygii TaxID=1427538 RepID=A0A5D0UBT4_9ACTN|nr:recombinase family protein [Actinomadura syzygii]TYC15053.1 recombinase family protein [Actinomadura syzygii]
MNRTPRRTGGRTLLETAPDQLVWALYGRESFDVTGDAEQVTAQLAEMREYVTGIGGRIGREFPENNVSAFRRVRVMLPDGTYGYRVVRPDWDAMMTELRKGTYNSLCLPNIDRGMRDPRDLEDLIDLVEYYGVHVVGMTGNIDLTTDTGISAARHDVNQRNQESRNIARRMQGGNRRAAMKGRNHGGANRPFGWRKDRISVNKREAKHIRREIPRLLAGVRPATIAIEWNERGIPTVTGRGQWRAMTIVQIFTNPRLCGWKTYRDEILTDVDGNPVKGVWEAIITDDEHLALVEAIRPSKPSRKNRGRGHVMKYLLSPFIRCGKCNARMYGGVQYYHKKTGKPVVAYRCPTKGWGGCGGITRIAAPIDEYVTELVIQEQSRIRLQRRKELPPWDREDELRDVAQQIQESTDAYKAKRISGSRYFALIEDLEASERRLKAEKRKYEAKRQARAVEIPDLRAEWNRPDFTLEQKHAAIAKSITALIIHPAPRQGAKFSPDQITPIWNEEDE